jgi:hypothetical protein
MMEPLVATVFQLGMVAIEGIEFGACVARLAQLSGSTRAIWEKA